MKSNLKFLVIVLFLSLQFNTKPFAQAVNSVPVIKNGDTMADAAPGIFINTVTRDSESAMLKKNFPKVAARFASKFPSASSPLWIKKDRLLFIYFVSNGQKASAVFTPRGHLNYSIAALNASAIPETVNRRISEEYSSYTIIHVRQITTDDISAYQVILENCAGYVVIHSTEEEIVAVDKVIKTDN